jgi:predicted nucleotidyltransferase
MEFVERVFKELRDNEVRYVVVGGVALLLHGVVRLTLDLDLAVLLERDNLTSFLGVMEKLGMRPRVPVPPSDILDPDKVAEWKSEKNMKAFTFLNPREPGDEIDLLIEEIIPFDEIMKDAVTFSISGVPVKVVSIEHLKKMKSISGRAQDLADLESLAELEKIRDEQR